MTKTNVSIKNFSTIPIGKDREQIRKEEMVEASFSKQAKKLKEE